MQTTHMVAAGPCDAHYGKFVMPGYIFYICWSVSCEKLASLCRAMWWCWLAMISCFSLTAQWLGAEQEWFSCILIKKGLLGQPDFTRSALSREFWKGTFFGNYYYASKDLLSKLFTLKCHTSTRHWTSCYADFYVDDCHHTIVNNCPGYNSSFVRAHAWWVLWKSQFWQKSEEDCYIKRECQNIKK